MGNKMGYASGPQSAPYAPPDQSMGDGRDGMDDMDDKDKVDVTDTFVPDLHLTSKNRLLVEEITEGADTTALHHYQPKAARVSSVRRLLNWFMSRFWQSALR